MIGEIVENGESGHGENLFFAHQAHGFVAELNGVINGFDASAGGVQSARLARRVDGDAVAGARGFTDGGGEFFFGVLVRSGEAAVDDLIGTGFVNFDKVGALFQFGANCGDEFGVVVRVGGVSEDVLLGVVADGVFVAAENADGVAADAQARAGNQALVDCVADGCVCGAGAFGAHVAFGGESGEQIVASGEGGENRALRNGFLNGLQIFRAGMQEEVDVRVDQAGEKCGVAEIDEFGGVRVIHLGADFYDESALDEDFPGSNGAASFYVEQARGVEDDGARSRGGRGLRLVCLPVD